MIPYRGFESRPLRQLFTSQRKPDENSSARTRSRFGSSLAVLVWNYRDIDLPAAPARIRLRLRGVPRGAALLHHYRVDSSLLRQGVSLLRFT